MMDKKKLIKLVSDSINVPLKEKDFDRSFDTIEEWDSLATLTILTAIDENTDNKSSKISGLATAKSIKEIYELLASNKLVS